MFSRAEAWSQLSVETAGEAWEVEAPSERLRPLCEATLWAHSVSPGWGSSGEGGEACSDSGPTEGITGWMCQQIDYGMVEKARSIMPLWMITLLEVYCNQEKLGGVYWIWLLGEVLKEIKEKKIVDFSTSGHCGCYKCKWEARLKTRLICCGGKSRKMERT